MWSLISLTNIESIIVINVIDIRDFSKRIVDSIDLNKSEEGVYRLKKTWYID